LERILSKENGEKMHTTIIAEAGINHLGSIDLCMQLIDGAVFGGADIFKLQKRDINSTYTKEELNKYRESPFGLLNRDLKKQLEFNEKEYDIIKKYCDSKNIELMVSAWDLASQNFLKKYNCKYNKVASARLGHKKLLEEIAKEGKYTFISTGMATIDEIGEAIKIFNNFGCPFELMACNSSYPCPDEDLNLLTIKTLRDTFGCKVGFSSHSPGIIPCVLAVALGATSIEAHLTTNRTLYGSDQASSIEIHGFKRMVDYVRDAELQLGDGIKVITETEKKIREKLYRTEDIQ
jgi:N-acetylneuraminate synthase